jgi:hypothetical protein
MSNVTLDAATLNAIAMPVSKVLPRMQNIDLINFAHAILALDAAAPRWPRRTRTPPCVRPPRGRPSSRSSVTSRLSR